MSVDNIETQIRRLLDQNYDPWSENEVVHAINDPIIYEIANWIFSVLRQTITNIDSKIVETMAEDIFYEFFASDKWLRDYDLVECYKVFDSLA